MPLAIPLSKACLICSGTRAVALTDRSRFDMPVGYVVCTGCGLVHRAPPLTPGEAARIYSSGFYADENAPDKSQARNYEKLVRDRDPIDPARLEFIGRHLDLNRPGTVLEIGCGVGSLLGRLHERGWQAWGIEPDPGMCAFVRGRWEDIEIVQGTVEAVELPSGQYDLVMMLHVFEHLLDPVAALHRVGSALKPNGLLFIEVPNILDMWTVHRRWYDGFDFTHVYNFSRKTLDNMLQLGGFEVVGARATHVLKVVARRRPGPAPRFAREDCRNVVRRIRVFRIKHLIRRITKNAVSFISRLLLGPKAFESAKGHYRALKQRLGLYR